MADRETTPARRKAQEISGKVIATGDLDEPAEGTPSAGVEMVFITDKQGRGVNLSCVADISLIESALNLIQQVIRAALFTHIHTKHRKLRFSVGLTGVR